MAERKFILVTKTPRGRVCYRGEGTRSQIEKDFKKAPGSDFEILPVVGDRKTISSIGFIVLGFGLGYLVRVGYENLFKKCKKCR